MTKKKAMRGSNRDLVTRHFYYYKFDQFWRLGKARLSE